MPKCPFEATASEIERDADAFVDVVFHSLESEFLTLPKGEGFVDYSAFDGAYEKLKHATAGFSKFDKSAVAPLVLSCPIALVVLRAMLGFSPPEWAYVATIESGVEVTQGFARSLDRAARMSPGKKLSVSAEARPRFDALIAAACRMLSSPAPNTQSDRIHRLDKADTKDGTKAIKSLADLSVPYSMLLYERFLGRPFAGHRDSVSDLVGAGLEGKIEEVLVAAGISYVKTKRAQQVPGFDQAPDFMIPNQLAPRIVIEAKITEDDGTARDKVTRVQHLRALSAAAAKPFEVVACIGGRGFGVRRADMEKLLKACRGKVFTMKQLDSLVENTGLRSFRTVRGPK